MQRVYGAVKCHYCGGACLRFYFDFVMGNIPQGWIEISWHQKPKNLESRLGMSMSKWWNHEPLIWYIVYIPSTCQAHHPVKDLVFGRTTFITCHGSPANIWCVQNSNHPTTCWFPAPLWVLKLQFKISFPHISPSQGQRTDYCIPKSIISVSQDEREFHLIIEHAKGHRHGQWQRQRMRETICMVVFCSYVFDCSSIHLCVALVLVQHRWKEEDRSIDSTNVIVPCSYYKQKNTLLLEAAFRRVTSESTQWTHWDWDSPMSNLEAYDRYAYINISVGL